MEFKILIPINNDNNRNNLEQLSVLSKTKKLTNNQKGFISDLANHLVNGSGASIYEFPPTLDKDFLYCSVIYSLAKDLGMKFMIIVNNHEKILNLNEAFYKLSQLTINKNTYKNHQSVHDNKPNVVPFLERKFSCLNYDKLLKSNSLDYDNYCIEQNASWNSSNDNCPFYRNSINYCQSFQSSNGNDIKMNGSLCSQAGSGAFEDIEDQFRFFSKNKVCPFYMNLHMIQSNQADIIICQNKDFTDYRKRMSLRKIMGENNLAKYQIIFDECNNINEYLVSNYSNIIDEDLIFKARIELYNLREKINKYITMNYSMNIDDDNQYNIFPKAEKEILIYSLLVNEDDAKFPGTIRKSSHFLNCMSRLLIYFSNLLAKKKEYLTSIYSFQYFFLKELWLDFRTLKSLYKRLLYQFYQIKFLDYHEMYNLIHCILFMSSMAQFNEGFFISSSTYKSDKGSKLYLEMLLMEPLTQYPLNNPIRANITMLSGGIGNIEIFSKLINNKNYLVYNDDSVYQHHHKTLFFTNVSTTTPINNSFYGEILKKLSLMIPDGIICYFSSTSLMEDYIKKWNDQGVLDYILNYKLLFIEEQNSARLSQIMCDYKKSCQAGRGGVLLLSVRNKASHFDGMNDEFSRGIVFIGFPIETKITKTLELKLEHYKKSFDIDNKEILHYDTFKLFTQKIVNKIHSSTDKKVIIILEEKLLNDKMKEYLPQWLSKFIHSDEDEENTTIEDRIKQILQFLDNDSEAMS